MPRAASSPLARGTLCSHELDCTHRRFIPAGAGNTPVPLNSRPSASLHPRWRGEHDGAGEEASQAFASSPLARGTLLEPLMTEHARRFIPAGAGNTGGYDILGAIASLHPRWRGEHQLEVAKAGRAIASSPLARGTRPGRPIRRVDNRFIPAGAGNTLVHRFAPPCAASSPLARGTRKGRGRCSP